MKRPYLATLVCALFGLGMLVGIEAKAQSSTTTIYTDVTNTHVPADSRFHALDAVMLYADGGGALDVAVAV